MVFVTSWGFALDVWYLSHWTGVLVGPDYCWSFKSGQRRGTQRTPLQRGRGFIFLSNQTKPADIGQKSSRHEVSGWPRSQIQLTRLCCQGLGKRRYSWYGGRLARDTGSLEYTVGVTCWALALWSFTWKAQFRCKIETESEHIFSFIFSNDLIRGASAEINCTSVIRLNYKFAIFLAHFAGCRFKSTEKCCSLITVISFKSQSFESMWNKV